MKTLQEFLDEEGDAPSNVSGDGTGNIERYSLPLKKKPLKRKDVKTFVEPNEGE